MQLNDLPFKVAGRGFDSCSVRSFSHTFISFLSKVLLPKLMGGGAGNYKHAEWHHSIDHLGKFYGGGGRNSAPP